MTALPRTLRRLAALGLLLAAVPVAVFVTVVPVASRIAALREEIATEREVLGRFARAAAQQSEAAEIDRIGRAAIDSGAYLAGESESIRAAGLQRWLAELAAADRVRLYSTRALERRERDRLELIGVRVQFHAEIAQVRALLHRIETARPFLFVEALHIHPLDAFSPGDPEHGGILDVRFDVYGAVPRNRE